MSWTFNPFSGKFDYFEPVDQAANYNWTGTHNWGSSGVAGFCNWFADESGKGLVWDGDATPGNPVLKLTGKSNTDKHFQISVGLTSKPSGGSFFSPVYIDATTSYAGAGMISVAQQFDLTDSRTINAAGTDIVRAFSMNVFRSTSFSSNQAASANMEGLFSDIRDQGTYSNSGGSGWQMIGLRQEYTVSPTVALTSAKSYPLSLYKMARLTNSPAGTGLTNLTFDLDLFDLGAPSLFTSSFLGWGKINLTGINFNWTLSHFGGGQLDIQFIDYNPSVTSPTTHHFAKIMKGRTWIGADGADTTSTWDGQLCFGAGTGGTPDSAIYDDGTYLAIATNFAASGGTRGIHFVDQVYTAGAPAATGYVTFRVNGVDYKFLTAT